MTVHNVDPLLTWFDTTHLADSPARDMSRTFESQAWKLNNSLPPSDERTVALRKLLEAKDAAVRCAIAASR